MKNHIKMYRSAGLLFFLGLGLGLAQENSTNNNPLFKSPQHLASAQFNYPELTGDKSGNYNLDFFLTIDKESPTYYWALQFYFVDGKIGYMGLQTTTTARGDDEKIALFSIWDSKKAESAPNGSSEAYSHEGSGFSTRIKYNWQEGKQYRVRVWTLGDVSEENKDTWWGAWVMDMETEKEDFIGKILVPASWKKLQPISVNFTEYYGTQDGKQHPCSIIGQVKTTYTFPTMNNGTIKPIHTRYVNDSACKNTATINPLGDNAYQVVTGTRQ